MNPNNCTACDNKTMNNGTGWCYMWEDEPTTRCYQHSAYDRGARILSCGGRMVGKSYVLMVAADLARQLREPVMPDAIGPNGEMYEFKLARGEVGRLKGFNIIIDEISDWAKQCEVKPVRIQHGPVRKGRGGKVRKW